MDNLIDIAKISQNLQDLSCKNLIDYFNRSSGGTFTCMYDKQYYDTYKTKRSPTYRTDLLGTPTGRLYKIY